MGKTTGVEIGTIISAKFAKFKQLSDSSFLVFLAIVTFLFPSALFKDSGIGFPPSFFTVFVAGAFRELPAG